MSFLKLKMCSNSQGYPWVKKSQPQLPLFMYITQAAHVRKDSWSRFFFEMFALLNGILLPIYAAKKSCSGLTLKEGGGTAESGLLI